MVIKMDVEVHNPNYSALHSYEQYTTHKIPDYHRSINNNNWNGFTIDHTVIIITFQFSLSVIASNYVTKILFRRQ